jgi:COMPASS component SWD3
VAEADRKQRFLQIQDNRADLTLDGGPPACAAFSGDGRLFATGTMNGLVLLWDVHESKLRHELRNGRLPIQNVAFDDPGRLLAGLSRSNQVVFWDTQSGLESVPLQLPTGNQAYGLALHPRDRVFAVGLADGAIEIRTGTDNRLLRTLGKHNAQVLALAYLADGQRLLSRDHEGVCKLWDPATGREVLTLIHSSQRGP